jgi:hypothetical protein
MAQQISPPPQGQPEIARPRRHAAACGRGDHAANGYGSGSGRRLPQRGVRQSRRGPASRLPTSAGVLRPRRGARRVLAVPWIPQPQPAAAVAPSGHALREHIRPSRSSGAGGAATSRGDLIGCHAMIGLVVFFQIRESSEQNR